MWTAGTVADVTQVAANVIPKEIWDLYRLPVRTLMLGGAAFSKCLCPKYIH